jgi:HipA-like protein
MPLTAVRHIRKMRGGAQAHLLEADDGRCYVVKFRNNPQHRRVLVNELLASVFLRYLQIAAPPTTMVQITPDFLTANPEVHLTLGTRRIDVEPGWHFASQYPGDPNRIAVYDFLPDALLGNLANPQDFRAILVFDKWTGNADGRQCIFFRARLLGNSPDRTATGFVAQMIDHGFAFNGPNWDFPDSPLQGLYARRLVYDGVRSLDDFRPWLDMVANFPEAVMDQAWKQIPPDWLEGEEEALEQMLVRLLERRKRVPQLIEACRSMRTNPFPNWA